MDAVQTVHLPSTDPPIGVSAYRTSHTSSVAFPLTLVDGYLTIYPSASMQYTGGVYLELETEDGERVVVAETRRKPALSGIVDGQLGREVDATPHAAEELLQRLRGTLLGDAVPVPFRGDTAWKLRRKLFDDSLALCR